MFGDGQQNYLLKMYQSGLKQDRNTASGHVLGAQSQQIKDTERSLSEAEQNNLLLTFYRESLRKLQNQETKNREVAKLAYCIEEISQIDHLLHCIPLIATPRNADTENLYKILIYFEVLLDGYIEKWATYKPQNAYDERYSRYYQKMLELILIPLERIETIIENDFKSTLTSEQKRLFMYINTKLIELIGAIFGADSDIYDNFKCFYTSLIIYTEFDIVFEVGKDKENKEPEDRHNFDNTAE